MISITGAFSYQPPGQDRGGFIPATFSIALAILGEDGVPVIDQRNQLGRLSATVIIGYPQIAWGDAFVLKLKSIVFGPPPPNFVHVAGEFDLSRTTAPPPGWLPGAILIQLDNTWTAVITAAPPAVTNSGIAFDREPGQIEMVTARGTETGLTAPQ
jgi:hypothetical protein